MLELMRDMFGFLAERKRYWLLPFILVFIALGALVAVAQYSAASPFLYTFF